MCKEAHERKLLIFATKADPCFISSGLSNWKHALRKFKALEISDCLKESCSKISAMQSGVNVAATLNSAKLQDLQNSHIALYKAFSSLLHLAKQGQAIRGHTDEMSNFHQF